MTFPGQPMLGVSLYLLLYYLLILKTHHAGNVVFGRRGFVVGWWTGNVLVGIRRVFVSVVVEKNL